MDPFSDSKACDLTLDKIRVVKVPPFCGHHHFSNAVHPECEGHTSGTPTKSTDTLSLLQAERKVACYLYRCSIL